MIHCFYAAAMMDDYCSGAEKISALYIEHWVGNYLQIDGWKGERIRTIMKH